MCSSDLLIILMVAFYTITSHDEDLDLRLQKAQILYTETMGHITRKLLLSDQVYCVPDVNFQKCLNDHVNSIVITPPGQFSIDPFELNENQTLIISSGTTVILSDDANMPLKGGYVLGIIGQPRKKISNVTLIIDGTIDGNKQTHPYEKSGNECVKIDYAYNVKVLGSGVVRNCSGDGIDIDVSDTIFVSGVTIMDNSGAGLHIGSGRPIVASSDILAIGVTARENGFRHRRSGLDASWPNNNSIIYVLSSSHDNFRNWGLAGAGSLSVLGSSSGGTVRDVKAGASLSHINGYTRESNFENIYYIYNLVKRDIGRLLGKHMPEYLKALPYRREKA